VDVTTFRTAACNAARVLRATGGPSGLVAGPDDSVLGALRSTIGIAFTGHRFLARQEVTGTMALKHSRRGGESLKGLTARYDKTPFGSKKQQAKREKSDRKEADGK